MARSLDYPVFDSDNHFYETTDAFTKYLPAEYAGLVKYVQINGRTKIAVKNQISEFIPNPTFNKVAPPGAQELEFKLKNPSSKTKLKPGDKVITAPPRYIESPLAFFNPAERLELLNEQKIDRTMMYPTLASLLEERLADDPDATHAVVHSLNEWIHDHWTFNFEDRIFATPVITLPNVAKAIEELEWVAERGAKMILVRPAPVPDINGRRRSMALPEFDPFWKKVEEFGITVGLHVSDDGSRRWLNEWEGRTGEYLPFGTKQTGFEAIFAAEHRGIRDVLTSIIGHGLASRFPKIRFITIENGVSWVKPMADSFAKVYSRNPDVFDENPVETLKRSFYFNPFHEEDVSEIVDLVGVDRVLFGSDYPHSEGMFDPVTYADNIENFSFEDQAKIMGGNLANLLGIENTHVVPQTVEV